MHESLGMLEMFYVHLKNFIKLVCFIDFSVLCCSSYF